MKPQINIFSSSIFQLMREKMAYLKQASFVSSYNIAHADTKQRRELQSFDKVIKKNAQGQYALKQNGLDAVETGEEVNRESEMLQLHHINFEYQSIMNFYKRYNDMIRVVIGK